MEMYAKGLCFKCREKWSPNHKSKCKAKNLKVSIIVEDDSDVEPIEGNSLQLEGPTSQEEMHENEESVHEEFYDPMDGFSFDPSGYYMDDSWADLRSLKLCSISNDAWSGSRGDNTLRLKGQINGRTAHILIDIGSTHSFINSKSQSTFVS